MCLWEVMKEPLCKPDLGWNKWSLYVALTKVGILVTMMHWDWHTGLSDLSSSCTKSCDVCTHAMLTNIKSRLASHERHLHWCWCLYQAGPSHQDGGAAYRLGCPTTSWNPNTTNEYRKTLYVLWRHLNNYRLTTQTYMKPNPGRVGGINILEGAPASWWVWETEWIIIWNLRVINDTVRKLARWAGVDRWKTRTHRCRCQNDWRMFYIVPPIAMYANCKQLTKSLCWKRQQNTKLMLEITNLLQVPFEA